jgi:glycosyltransferase involved in cell wall biosynthesis
MDQDFPMPSRRNQLRDEFGLVVLETMASGVLVIAMSHGGPKFVVEIGTTSWLARDDDEFVAATLRMRAREWSWDSVFDGLYNRYSGALEGVSTAPSAVPA